MSITISEMLIEQLFKLNVLAKRDFFTNVKDTSSGEDSQSSNDIDVMDIPHERGPRFRERILCILEEIDGISQRKLSLILAIRPQSISELLSKLERDELIKRMPNENDRREVLVFLTEKGRERIKTFEEMKRYHAEKFLQALDSDEKARLSELFDKLIEFNDPDDKDIL